MAFPGRISSLFARAVHLSSYPLAVPPPANEPSEQDWGRVELNHVPSGRLAAAHAPSEQSWGLSSLTTYLSRGRALPSPRALAFPARFLAFAPTSTHVILPSGRLAAAHEPSGQGGGRQIQSNTSRENYHPARTLKKSFGYDARLHARDQLKTRCMY